MSHVLSDRWLALSSNQLNPRFEQHYFAVKAKFFPAIRHCGRCIVRWKSNRFCSRVESHPFTIIICLNN